MIINYIKRGTYNSFFFALSSTLVRAINFLFLPYLLSQLTLEEFGIWDFYQLIFSYSTLLLSSVAATGMIRFYLLYQDDEIKKKQSIGNGLLTALCGAFLFPFAALFLYKFHFFSFDLAQLLFISLSISFFTLFSLVLAYIRMQEKVVSYLVFFCGQNIIATILTLIGISLGYRIKALWYGNAFSFFIFLPVFAKLFWNYRFYSYSIFKEQLNYSLPLVIYSFMYASFFSVDRLYLQKVHGYEMLGVYALLWRFGALFQFVAIALIDAWPLLIYNAQKEQNERILIAQLMRYFILALVTIGIFTVLGSFVGIMLFFPHKYHFLLKYLPGFFIPLIFLEIARVFQAGFTLSTKTAYIPVLGIGALATQISLLILTGSFNMWGIFLANSACFFLYGSCSFYLSNREYQTSFSFRWFIKLIVLLFFHLTLIECCIFTHVHYLFYFLVVLIWPISLFMSHIIAPHEQLKLTHYIHEYIVKLFSKVIPSTPILINNIHSLLYLRTDICSDEITAGGSIAHTLGVINAFQKKGTNIIIASSAMQTILKNNFTPNFIHLRMPPLFFLLRWKLGYLRWRLECIFSTFFFAFKLRDLFKKNRFDALYQRYSLLNATGLLLSSWYKIPLILEYNGSEVWQFHQLAPKKWFKFNFYAQIIESLNLTYAHSIIVVSQALKDDLVAKNIDPRKILVNPNGVDTDVYNPLALIQTRHKIRTQLCLENKFVVGFVGTFSFWHGIEMIASIIPHVIKYCPTIHFLLIGDGMLKPYLVQEIERTHSTNYVTLTGLVSAECARDYLAACDAFICPTQPNRDGTRFFGSPTKLFEYLSMAKPIIASNLEQLSEVISPAITRSEISSTKNNDQFVGILVEPDDMQGFVDSICALANLSVTKQNEAGSRARLKAQQHYSWSDHVHKIEQFIMRSL